jgi:hypothetical protein
MSEEIVLRSKKPPIEIPLKSVGEILWEKLRELNKDSTCIVSKVKHNKSIKIKKISNICVTVRSKQKVVQN